MLQLQGQDQLKAEPRCRRICSNVKKWFDEEVAKSILQGWRLESKEVEDGFYWAVLTSSKD
jgi:hypothetical protein